MPKMTRVYITDSKETVGDIEDFFSYDDDDSTDTKIVDGRFEVSVVSTEDGIRRFEGGYASDRLERR